MAGATAAAGLSRLTGYRAGKPRANELQAEARLSLFAIDQFSLSSPTPSLAGSMVTRETPGALPGASQRDPLCIFSARSQTAAALFALQIRCDVTTRVIEQTSPAPILRWVPVA